MYCETQTFCFSYAILNVLITVTLYPDSNKYNSLDDIGFKMTVDKSKAIT